MNSKYLLHRLRRGISLTLSLHRTEVRNPNDMFDYEEYQLQNRSNKRQRTKNMFLLFTTEYRPTVKWENRRVNEPDKMTANAECDAVNHVPNYQFIHILMQFERLNTRRFSNVFPQQWEIDTLFRKLQKNCCRVHISVSVCFLANMIQSFATSCDADMKKSKSIEAIWKHRLGFSLKLSRIKR